MNDRKRLKEAKKIVVKIGTTSLTYANGKLNLTNVEKLAWVLSDLHNQGKDIILVSSGAIAVGAQRLGLSERPRDIQERQATSAVGQAILMQIYENFFSQYNQKVAQILLTKDAIHEGQRRVNAVNTFNKLAKWNVIPIVNENDTISVDELGFSDNDNLSAQVALLTESDCLIILSDIDGVYDSDPNKNKEAKLIKKAKGVNDYLKSIAGDSASELGTGGMSSKIDAASYLTTNSIDVIIAQGSDASILIDILDGKDVGTMICKKE